MLGNVGIGTTTPTPSFNARLAVRNEDAANNPTLTLFKNITSESSEDIFRVQSWNGAFNTVASIKANGNATFGSTNGIVTVNRSSTSFASLFKMSTAGVENWSIGVPTLSSADWVLFNHATGIPNLSFASSTGAATFSNSIYGTNALFGSSFLSNETSKIGIGFESGYGLVNSWGANTSTYGGLKLQISVSNGATFNALTIAPSGFVGIGTNASLPYGRFEVADVSQLTNAGQWASATISMKQVSGVIGNYSQIVFGYHSNTQTNGSAYIGYVATNQGTNGYGDLVFGTRAVNTDTQPTERFRISSTGAATFTTNSNSTILNTFQNTDTTNSNTRNYFNIVAGTNRISLYSLHSDNNYINTAYGDLYFQMNASTSATNPMIIKSSGNVLIGTNTSNGALLEVKQPTLAIASIFQAWAPGVAGANFRVISTTGQPYMQYDFNNGKMGVNLSDTLATLATLGGAVQFMGDYRNHQTIIKSAGTAGTFSGQLTITIPEMSNASIDGFGAYSCEVYVSGFPNHYCHVWFSGYINGGITVGEVTILRSNGGWSVSQSAIGTNSQGFQFIINYPDTFIHPAARIIFNKGGSTNAFEYPANSITAVFS